MKKIIPLIFYFFCVSIHTQSTKPDLNLAYFLPLQFGVGQILTRIKSFGNSRLATIIANLIQVITLSPINPLRNNGTSLSTRFITILLDHCHICSTNIWIKSNDMIENNFSNQKKN